MMFSLPRYKSVKIRKFVSSLSTLSSINKKPKYEPAPSWNKSIADAEKVIGYPTSFLNLRWLLSDEVANVAGHLRKLLGTNHPLLSIAKDLIMNTETPSWGLIVLLVAKVGGQNTQFKAIDKDITAGILHNQRILAEVTEMIKTSKLLHKSLLNTNLQTPHREDMDMGNKIALLCGDYLLSSSYKELANIKNYSLNELMSSALRDIVDGEFVGPRDRQNQPLPSKPNPKSADVEVDIFGTSPLQTENILGNARSEWTVHALLSGGTLLGKSCKGVLKLGGHDEEFQEYGYELGKNIAFSLRIRREYEATVQNKITSLVSAPILFHLKREPDFYFEFEDLQYRERELNYGYICESIRRSGALEDTKRLQEEFIGRSLEVLRKFKDNDSKIVLRKIIQTSRI